MLLNDLFTIDDLRPEDGAARAVLLIDAGHPIFGGHFPGRPLLPGACQLQVVREVLSAVMGSECRLLKADQIKFLTMIDPLRNHRVELALRYAEGEKGLLRVTASMSAGDAICFKFSGTFQAG